ncbi:hypothetical protein [Nannocystis bainbridge]|uniref:Lipoprotein n=1 Tax=Nannocystis bainbridge TaxID=2995303 RepID=A0ABT5DT97_9BACT|nr:hypothetical protein [Nannocystis bainbridge]MDC0715637.1 hypothetical protein [Nannocystis bainbridge]
MQPTSWRSIALVLAGIILGCSANAMRGAQAQPAFPANPAATRWQQYCEHVDGDEEANERAQAAGAQGFELAALSLYASNTDDLVICFKRPAP